MTDLFKAHCVCGHVNVVEGNFLCAKCQRPGEIDWRAEITKLEQEAKSK